MDANRQNANGELLRQSDEQLAGLLSDPLNGPAAVDILVRRHWDSINRYVGWLARPFRLQPRDVENAQQSAWLAVVRGLPRYRADPTAGPRRFKVWLRRVARNAFLKFLEKIRSRQRRLDRSASATDLADGKAHPGSSWRLTLAAGKTDPAPRARHREARAKVLQVVRRFGKNGMRLYRGLKAGTSLEELGPPLGLSPHAAKALKRDLRAAIRLVLADYVDGDPATFDWPAPRRRRERVPEGLSPEAQELVRQVVSGFGETAVRLYQGLEAKPLKQLADDLGIEYKKAKALKRKVRAAVERALADANQRPGAKPG